jgi:TM2 domain-containing membrane protein YozV
MFLWSPSDLYGLPMSMPPPNQDPYGGQSSDPYGGQPGYGSGQPGYGASTPGYGSSPGYGQQQSPVPYGVDPSTGLPMSDKSKMVAGLLQIFLGGFGVGRFYTGHTGMAIGQIAATWLTCGIGGLWPLIDGIMILVNGGTDAQGRRLKDN